MPRLGSTFACIYCGFEFPRVGQRIKPVCAECRKAHPPGRPPARTTAVLVVALAAEAARVRMINEQARARLAMGIWGHLCQRDDLLRAAAEAHDLLAGSRPLGKPAIPHAA